MKLREWLGTGIAKMLAPLAGPIGIMRGIFSGRRGDLPKWGTREHLETFDAAPWPRAVGDKVGTAVACTDLRLYALTRGGKVVRDRRLQTSHTGRQKLLAEVQADLREIAEHPFLDGLNSPNPFMDRMALLKLTEIHLDFVGDAFWLKDRNALGKPAGYWPIPPHWVIETPTPEFPTFRVSWRAWQATIPASEIHWFHEPAPANPYARGTGVGWALGDEIQVDEYAAKMAAVFFLNRARPDFVFATGQGDVETKRLEQDWVSRLQGFWRSHRPYFFAGGDDTLDLKKRIYEFQQPTMEQLVYPNLRKIQRDIILQTWGVPPELFGIVENSNRATIEAAEYLFTKWVVAPKAERMRASLQRLAAEEFDERIIVHAISPVAEDKEHQLSVIKAAPHSLSLDEFRQLAGLQPIGGKLGASRLVPLASYVTEDPLDLATRPQGGGAAMRAGDVPPEAKPPAPKAN